MTHVSLTRLTAAAAAALALAACGGPSEEAPKTQVAVKVNSQEITVHQVNELVAQVRNVPEAQVPRVRREALERLIDQELFMQKAIEAKLDRDPRVMGQIQAARRQILAQAYAESIGRQVQPPPSDEVKQFYAARPELFGERRVYRLREVAIAVPPEQRQPVSERVASARTMNELVSWLGSQNIRYAGNAAVRAAEQLPMEMAARLAQVKDGAMLGLPSPVGFTVVEVSGSQRQPVSEQQAQPFIEQYIVNNRRREATATELKQLRSAAKIEYVGDYAKLAGPKGADAAASPAAVTSPSGGDAPASVLDAPATK